MIGFKGIKSEISGKRPETRVSALRSEFEAFGVDIGFSYV